jgi:uncharacterized protein YjeT (DUF2065 family)
MATLPSRLATVAAAAIVVVVAVLYPFLVPLAPGAVAVVASRLALRSLRRYGLVAAIET